MQYFLSETFSTITVKFTLAREVGHYVLDYYLPSILLVAMSWVSFWLDPSAVPGRTTLGESAFISNLQHYSVSVSSTYVYIVLHVKTIIRGSVVASK